MPWANRVFVSSQHSFLAHLPALKTLYLGIPKYKVLSAGKCARKECCEDTKTLFAQGNECIKSDVKIDTLINQIADTDKKYPVIDAVSGELIGEIDRSIVLKSMTS